MANLLFICSKNQWRSPTAELLFKDNPEHQARSAGTGDKARIRVNQKMIDWADEIFVMEYKHRDLLKKNFNISSKKSVVLNIPDEYHFNDPELVAILKTALSAYL